MSAFRGWSPAWLRSTFAVAALFALLAPTAGLLANSQFAGWSPDHGHLSRRARIATHLHPYDDHHSASPDAAVGSDVTFTPADDAGSAPTLALAREPAALPAPARPLATEAAPAPRPMAAAAAGVPTPPPRA